METILVGHLLEGCRGHGEGSLRGGKVVLIVSELLSMAHLN